MSHDDQVIFVKQATDHLKWIISDASVLEVGSLDINGSVRPYFNSSRSYIGLDLAVGPGVDVVCAGQDFAAPDRSIDIVVSCECLEHNRFWQETLENIFRLLRPGGVLILSCATTGRPEHGTPRTTPEYSPFTSKSDGYYRNLTRLDLESSGVLSGYQFIAAGTSHRHHDLYLVAQKAGGNPLPLHVRMALKRSLKYFWVRDHTPGFIRKVIRRCRKVIKGRSYETRPTA